MSEQAVVDLIQNELLKESPIPFAVYQFVDHKVKTRFLSKGFCDMFGLEHDEAIFLMDYDMYRDSHPDDIARISDDAYYFATEDRPYDVFYRTKRLPSQEYFIVHAVGRHMETEAGRIAIVWYTDEGPFAEGEEAKLDWDQMNADLRKRIVEERRLSKIHFDDLTGLPTTEYFMELAERFRAGTLLSGNSPAMLFFDLNGIKAYNETYGYKEGDLLLQGVADILKTHYGADSCSRFGPDHFVVFTRRSGELEEELETIFGEIALLNDGRSLPVRTGIYIDDTGQTDSKTACDRAKIACDQEKERYESAYFFFDESMLLDLSKRSYIRDNLDRALSEGWINVYYQPIVRSVTGLVCNEEALSRWIDPEQGMISPVEFIPILEESQMLYRLDLYVVGVVIDHIRERIRKKMRQVPISVNLSWDDFRQCDMLEEICTRMDRAGISYDLLNIEITERTIGEDPDYMKQQIKRFHEKGFSVWMDDFGSGYSSLEVLQNYDFDVLKFTMQFMQDLETSPKSRVILTELMHMATRLGIDTLTEGVETEEQVQFLREIGCDKIQGFYYSRPNSQEEVLRRYEVGEGIGMEDHREAAYYDLVSKTGLNDPTVTNFMSRRVTGYFSGVPMGILEAADGAYRTIRYNRLFAELLKGEMETDADHAFEGTMTKPLHPGPRFRDAIARCIDSDDWVYIDNVHLEDLTLNAFVRKLAYNPVSGATAILTIFLSMMESENNS